MAGGIRGGPQGTATGAAAGPGRESADCARTTIDEERPLSSDTTKASDGFTKGSNTYDEAVRHNIAGSDRLVMSLPDGHYPTVLDVGCGTGWTSNASGDRGSLWTCRTVSRYRAMSEGICRHGAPS